MKKMLALLVAVVCCIGMSAEEISAERLKLAAEAMTVMRLEAQLKNSLASVKQMQRQMLPKMLEQMGVKPSAEQQRQQERLLNRAMGILEEEMDWAKLGPIMTESYASTFTEEQLRELIVFFKSPIGQVFLDKTPVLQQKMMAGLQEIVLNMQKKLSEAMKQELADIKAQKPETAPVK